MKSIVPSEPNANRVNEESLQQTFEAMLTEIKRMKLDSRDKKNLISMLLKYRSAWNSYINMMKSRHSRKVE